METEAQRRANLNYRKKAVAQLNIALYPADLDIKEWLDKQPNKAEYLRKLIRADIEKKSK